MKYDRCEGDSYAYFKAEQMSSEAKNENNEAEMNGYMGEVEAETSEIKAENTTECMFEAEMS
eukprot:15405803-Alexandrium_andersonii.AAC.1